MLDLKKSLNLRNTILEGHVVEQLLLLDNNSIDCIFTSPPYWGLRQYDTDLVAWADGWKGELGCEPQPDQYITHLMEVFEIVHQKLKTTGTLWVNLGDTYIGGGQAQGHDAQTTNFGISTENRGYVNRPIAKGKHLTIMDKSLAGIPSRFKIAMIDTGQWCCRSEFIWKKGNSLPSPHGDRGTVDYEKIFFLVKNNKSVYWYHRKDGRMTYKKPLGTSGIEDIDWEWKRHKRCDGEGCRTCKNQGAKKKTLWKVRDYFFETQYVKFAKDSLERYYREKVKGMTKRKGTKYLNLEGKVNPDFHRQYGAHDFYESKGKFRRTIIDDIEPSDEEYLAIIEELLTDYLTEPYLNSSLFIDVLTKGYKGAHFAVFPEKLVKLILDMGCPVKLCKKCLLPQQKIYHTKSDKDIEEYKGQAQKNYAKAKAQNPSDTKRRILDSMSQVVTNILQTKCNCNAGWINGLVVDIFGGRGTVAKVAYDTDRDYISIERSPKFIKLAKKFLGITGKEKRSQRLMDML